MTQDLNKQFNIPAWVKGNTIADESASIMKRFEGRNDNASIATKEALLKSVMKKQEFLKMQEAMKTQSQQVPDNMNGEVPEGMEQFMEPQEGQMAYGGVKQYWEGGKVTPIQTNLMGIDAMPGAGIDPTMVAGTGADGGPLGVATGGAGIGDISGAATSLLNAGQDIFGKPNVDVKGTQNYDINQFKKDKLTKGIGGAVNIGKGIVTGDPMAIVSGGAALLGSVFGGGKKEMETANARFVQGQNANLRQSDFAFGGAIDGGINPLTQTPVTTPTDPLREGISKVLVDRSKLYRQGIEDKRLGAFPEVGSQVDHSSNNRRYKVLFNDPNKDRSMVQDDLGAYSLQSNRNLQLGNKGEGWETGGEQPMTSADAQYFMKNTRPTQMKMGGLTNPYDNTNLNDPSNAVFGTMGIINTLQNQANSLKVAPPTDYNSNKTFIKDKPNFAVDEAAFDKLDNQARLDRDTEFLQNDKGTQKAVDDKAKKLNGIEKITGEQNFVDRKLNWLNENAANIGQFSPVLSNLLELKNLKKSPTQRGTRLDSVYKEYNPDEARQLNLLNQQNTERALTETSTGNLGSLRNQLQAAGLNKLKGQSEVMSNIDQIKAGESAKGQQFKQQAGTVNAELDRDFLDRSARDKAAFETTKSNLKSALFEDVGKISKEHLDKKMVQKMFGYKWNGEYYTDKDGKTISTSDVWKQVKDLIGGDKTKKDK